MKFVFYCTALCLVSVPSMAQDTQSSSPFVRPSNDGASVSANSETMDINELHRKADENFVVAGLSDEEKYYLEQNYYGIIKNTMDRNPVAIKQMLSMSDDDLARLYVVLTDIETEASNRSLQKTEQMCTYWHNIQGPYTLSQKAELALNYYDELELTKSEMNIDSADRIFRVEEVLNLEAQTNLELQFLSYKAGLASFSVRSWAESVRETGQIENQLEYTCGADK